MAENEQKASARDSVDFFVSSSGIIVLICLFCFGELNELQNHDAKLHPQVKSDTSWRLATKVIAWIDIVYTCIGLFILGFTTCCGSLGLCVGCLASFGKNGNSEANSREMTTASKDSEVEAGGGDSFLPEGQGQSQTESASVATQNRRFGLMQGPDSGALVPCVFGVLWCLFSITMAIAVIFAAFQVWVTLKLLKSTEIGRDVHESLQLVKIWLIVTATLVAYTLLRYAVNKQYGQVVSNVFFRGLFIFIACMYYTELKNIAANAQ